MFDLVEVCAILYGDSNYEGWIYKVSEVESENIISKYNNDSSSIKIRNGCTFKGYRYPNQGELMFSATDDVENLGNFDEEISSYSCKCIPSKDFYTQRW